MGGFFGGGGSSGGLVQSIPRPSPTDVVQAVTPLIKKPKAPALPPTPAPSAPAADTAPTGPSQEELSRGVRQRAGRAALVATSSQGLLNNQTGGRRRLTAR